MCTDSHTNSHLVGTIPEMSLRYYAKVASTRYSKPLIPQKWLSDYCSRRLVGVNNANFVLSVFIFWMGPAYREISSDIIFA